MDQQFGGVQISNWFGDFPSKPAVVVKPSTVEEIVEIVRNPGKYPSPIRAVGSNHSTTRCAIAEGGTVILMSSLNRIVEIGKDYVTAQAGALYIDVGKELEKRGLQYYVNVELGNLTIGSGVCCGTKDGSLPGQFVPRPAAHRRRLLQVRAARRHVAARLQQGSRSRTEPDVHARWQMDHLQR